MKYLILAFWTCRLLQAQEISFSHGSDLKMTKMWGQVSVLCYDDINQNWQKYHCFQYHIESGNKDYLKVVNGNISADKVTLEREDNYFQAVSYDENLQQSINMFQLWDPALTGKGLLKLGENHLRVKFHKSDNIIKEDFITINVALGHEKECETGILSYPGNCPSTELICLEYFQKNNSCKFE